MATCPYCEAKISDTARKCCHCGEWVTTVGAPSEISGALSVPAQARYGPAPQDTCVQPPALVGTYAPGGPIIAPIQHPRQQVTVQIPREESVAFAVVTLLLYIFVYPVGLLLNLIGLLTGPRRGCFTSMFLVFFLIPVLVLLVLVGALGLSLSDLARELNIRL